MRGALNAASFSAANREELEAQISKMNGIVEYQLQRAAGKGKTQFTGTVDLSEIIHKILASLHKVYHDKQLQVELNIPESSPVYYEAGDLYEIIGNILDNAFKWGEHFIEIKVELAGNTQYQVAISIEDDGPGLGQDKIESILQRGVRADQSKDGHGIGMAVVQELLTLLNGQIEGRRSQELGGMLWNIYLP